MVEVPVVDGDIILTIVFAILFIFIQWVNYRLQIGKPIFPFKRKRKRKEAVSSGFTIYTLYVGDSPAKTPGCNAPSNNNITTKSREETQRDRDPFDLTIYNAGTDGNSICPTNSTPILDGGVSDGGGATNNW